MFCNSNSLKVVTLHYQIDIGVKNGKQKRGIAQDQFKVLDHS